MKFDQRKTIILLHLVQTLQFLLRHKNDRFIFQPPGNPSGKQLLPLLITREKNRRVRKACLVSTVPGPPRASLAVVLTNV